MNAFLEKYRDLGFQHVEGWCDPGLFEVMECIDSFVSQKDGGCIEIGVHHGKFFLLLNQLVEERFQSYAIDLFEQQELNIDFSGQGARSKFEENLRLFDRHQGRNTTIICGDSTDSSLNLESKCGLGVSRYISIDGGHTAEHTISDLRLANRLIGNYGIVILDDILNYHWLGVIEGACAFLTERPTLIPFAIGFNKLFFCKLSFHNNYLSALRSNYSDAKLVHFFGHQLISF